MQPRQWSRAAIRISPEFAGVAWHQPQVGDSFALASGSADAVDDETERTQGQ